MVEAVRLVIWDLDETFWLGTLSEGGLERGQHFGDIVQELNLRGIMNSICSKNDPAEVEKVIRGLGLWDSFIFPNISWDPKGQRVSEIIEQAQLRPETVLFIDDNPLNLREATHFEPALQIADETFIPSILADPRLVGKPDPSLSRLAKYKLLETKQQAQRQRVGDAEDFLRESEITVELVHDIEPQLDRAVELINRTNQLNFTKIRLSEDPAEARASLLAQISNYDVHAGLVRVRDKYGDYGLAGFFLQRKGAGYNLLSHYCFSCRTLGMFVETWVYRELSKPRLEIVGEVLTDLEDDAKQIDWIKHYHHTVRQIEQASAVGGVFMSGGCDLEAVSHYLRPVVQRVRLVANIIRRGAEIRREHSTMVVRSVVSPQGPERAFLEESGYRLEDFSSDFDAEHYSVAVFSFWADAHYQLYQHAGWGFVEPFGPSNLGQTDISTFFEHDLHMQGVPPEGLTDFRYVKAVARCIGITPEDVFKRNLRTIFSAIPWKTKLLVLGISEAAHCTHPAVLPRHQALNAWSRDVIAEFPNGAMLNIDDFVANPAEQLSAGHFTRDVYRRLATEILRCYNATIEASQASMTINLATIEMTLGEPRRSAASA